MDTLIKFAHQMGFRYRIYIPLMSKILSRHKLSFPNYEQLVKSIHDGVDVDEIDVDNLLSTAETSRKKFNRRAREKGETQPSPTTTESKRSNALDEIRQTWAQSPRRVSKEDWLEWLRNFNVHLIKESPALSLRSCFPIAQACNSVARDLFNPAFLTCWNELNQDQQKVCLS